MSEFFNGIPEAAKYLGCGVRTIDRLRASGEFPEPDETIETGKKKLLRWRAQTLDAFRYRLRGRGKPSGQNDMLERQNDTV